MKYFLLTGTTFALVWGLLNLPDIVILGPFFYLGMVLLGGFLFGGGMIIWAYFFDFKKIDQLPYKNEYDTNSVRHEKIVDLKMSSEKAFESVKKSIEHLERGEIENIDPSMGIVEARANKTILKSLKNRVTINMRSNGEGTRVRIKSGPSSPVAIMDSGQNMINVETIKRYLLEMDV